MRAVLRMSEKLPRDYGYPLKPSRYQAMRLAQMEADNKALTENLAKRGELKAYLEDWENRTVAIFRSLINQDKQDNLYIKRGLTQELWSTDPLRAWKLSHTIPAEAEDMALRSMIFEAIPESFEA